MILDNQKLRVFTIMKDWTKWTVKMWSQINFKKWLYLASD